MDNGIIKSKMQRTCASMSNENKYARDVLGHRFTIARLGWPEGENKKICVLVLLYRKKMTGFSYLKKDVQCSSMLKSKRRNNIFFLSRLFCKNGKND